MLNIVLLKGCSETLEFSFVSSWLHLKLVCHSLNHSYNILFCIPSLNLLLVYFYSLREVMSMKITLNIDLWNCTRVLFFFSAG